MELIGSDWLTTVLTHCWALRGSWPNDFSLAGKPPESLPRARTGHSYSCLSLDAPFPALGLDFSTHKTVATTFTSKELSRFEEGHREAPMAAQSSLPPQSTLPHCVEW